MNDMDELRELWEQPGFRSGYRDWRSDRIEFAAGFEPEVESFMAGSIDSKELSKKALAWERQGFRGNVQMFFDKLVKWFEPANWTRYFAMFWIRQSMALVRSSSSSISAKRSRRYCSAAAESSPVGLS